MRQSLRSIGLIAALLMVSLAGAVPLSSAAADSKAEAKCGSYGNCKATASGDGGDSDSSKAATGGSSRTSSGPTPEQQLATYQRALKSYESQLGNYRDCVAAANAETCAAPGEIAALTGALVTLTGTPGGPPLMSPSQAGAIAVARLQLPLNAPKVGPDPKVNKWKMAAVGYPLWVWAEGSEHIGPVSDSVAGLSVSLDAQLTKTVFQMGDGKSVTCTGGGTPYRKGVKAATPSPDCGYRYEKPSLPKGDYTVTAVAYWAVTWNVNGTSGVITVPRVASAPLPVGEVQVLVR